LASQVSNRRCRARKAWTQKEIDTERIKELEARFKELEEELTISRRLVDKLFEEGTSKVAENKRLREALEKIYNGYLSRAEDREIAKQALGVE